MKSITAYAGVRELAGQRKKLRQASLLPVKRRVEAGHLRNLGGLLRDDGNGQNVVRLMQRRQWRQGGQRTNDRLIDANRCSIPYAAMDDAMPDTFHRRIANQIDRQTHDLPGGAAMIKLLRRPVPIGDGLLRCVHDAQMGRLADPFYLSTEHQGLVLLTAVNCEFYA